MSVSGKVNVGLFNMHSSNIPGVASLCLSLCWGHSSDQDRSGCVLTRLHPVEETNLSPVMTHSGQGCHETPEILAAREGFLEEGALEPQPGGHMG